MPTVRLVWAFGQILCNLSKTITIKKHLVYSFYRFRFFRYYTRYSILTFSVSKAVKVSSVTTVLHSLLNTPLDVGTDVFTLGLCDDAEQTYKHFIFSLKRIESLLFKIHADAFCTELSCPHQTIYGITSKTGNRFSKNKIDLSLFAISH